MKKRLKVFESGNYPQGNFEADRVKAVFEKVVDKIPGIFAHSSHWAKKEEEPVSVGEFSNFELLNKNGKLVVFGDVEFNEKGAGYYNDKILEGVSVEIDPKTNTLHKIAVLPKGVKPQVAGAEFELKEDELQGIYLDRKSTRLNSSHANISYAVFCLKKKIIYSTLYQHLPPFQ